jgi:hypothetical protein
MPERQQIKQIDIGDLTENVTSAVRRALEAQQPPRFWRPPRIICGLILEPLNLPLEQEGPVKPQ